MVCTVYFTNQKFMRRNLANTPIFWIQSAIAETIGLAHLLFEILEQNMNINRTEDNKKSLKYVLISCIPSSSTSIFFPYLLLLSTKYPSRYSSMDTHLSKAGFE